MKRFFLIPLSLILYAGSAYSQATMNMAGGQKTINNEIHEWSVGEMAIISTDATSNMVVTHGVLQPVKNTTNSIQNIIQPIAVSIYPNPTSDKIQIDFKQAQLNDIQLFLYDATGRLIIQKSAISIMNKDPYVLSLEQLSQGVYTLKIIAKNNKSKVEGEFKIQKIN